MLTVSTRMLAGLVVLAASCLVSLAALPGTARAATQPGVGPA